MTNIIPHVQQLNLSKTKVASRGMNLAASWYVAMHSKDLTKKPNAFELFGRALVAWRDQKGQPVIMEPYCSHKGANLALGKLIDGCLQCPFHHWRYDSSGQCVSIPEIDHIPPMARQNTYSTVERYGYIWVWYGSKTPLFSVPKICGVEEDRHDYMPAYLVTKTNTTARQIIENALDFYHLKTVHKLRFSDPVQVTLLDKQHSIEMGTQPLEQEAWFTTLYEFLLIGRDGLLGPFSQALGFTTDLFRVETDVWPTGLVATFSIGNKVLFKELACVTPIAENKTNVMRLILVKKTGNLWLNILYRSFIPWLQNATLAEDVPILSDIQPDAGNAHVQYDWLLLKHRNFYQKWVDKVV